MAHFNPNQVTFNPSPQIMQSMNSIGDVMKQLYLQNYQESQDALRQSNTDRAFSFQKGRADVQDNQWQQTYDAGRQDAQARNDQWQKTYDQNATNHKDTISIQNKQLDISKQNLGINQQKLADDEAKNRATGMFIAQNYPSLAKEFGALTQTVDDSNANDVVTRMGGNTPKVTNVYDSKSLPALSALLPVYSLQQQIDAKDHDPYKALLAQSRVDEYNRKVEADKVKQQEIADKQRSINADKLKKAYSNDPKSILGIDPKDLSDQDQQALFSDMNNGAVGRYVNVTGAGIFDKKYKYVPVGTSAQPQQSSNNDPMGLR